MVLDLGSIRITYLLLKGRTKPSVALGGSKKARKSSASLVMTEKLTFCTRNKKE